jgi:hypothetical protein
MAWSPMTPINSPTIPYMFAYFCLCPMATTVGHSSSGEVPMAYNHVWIGTIGNHRQHRHINIFKALSVHIVGKRYPVSATRFRMVCDTVKACDDWSDSLLDSEYSGFCDRVRSGTLVAWWAPCPRPRVLRCYEFTDATSTQRHHL